MMERLSDTGILIVGALAAVVALVLLGALSWLGHRVERKTRHAAAAKNDQLLTEFPEECGRWGGRGALSDPAVVDRILSELEPQKE
jgi:hypothetical protein